MKIPKLTFTRGWHSGCKLGWISQFFGESEAHIHTDISLQKFATAEIHVDPVES